MKIKITLVKLGYIEHLVDFRKIENWKSEIFEIIENQCVEHLPEGDITDSYLDQKFNRENIAEIITQSENSDITVAIMRYRFIDNFYMHRVGGNCVAISLFGIPEILNIENISVENFIIKQIYEICAIKYLLKEISDDDIYRVVHRDTRGCLFDMNGDKMDNLYNTEKPIICESCKTKFREKQVESKIIPVFEKELKRIEKPLILRIERTIKKYPLISMVITGLIAVSLSIIANLIYDLIKMTYCIQ